MRNIVVEFQTDLRGITAQKLLLKSAGASALKFQDGGAHQSESIYK